MSTRMPHNPLDPRSTENHAPPVQAPVTPPATEVDLANAPREGCFGGENLGDPVAHGVAPKGVATLGTGRDPAKPTPRSTA